MRVSWSLSSLTVEGLVEEALRCEGNGFEGVWYPDYEAPGAEWSELHVSLGAVARSTERVTVGSFVTDVLRRHPMVTAHAFATLNQIAPGRVILGLGAGAGPSQAPYGIEMTALASRVAEGLQVIRALWASTPDRPAAFQGHHFTLDGAVGPLIPSDPIPIYLAAYGPRMLEITAAHGDGWIPESHTPATYQKTWDRLQALLRDFGRRTRDLEPCLAVVFYPFEPEADAYDRILLAARRYLATYPDIQWAAGSGKDHPGLRVQEVLAQEALWDELAAQVPEAVAEATLVYGPPEECVERLTRFAKAGCRHVILEPYWIEIKRRREAIDLAARELVPVVREL